MSLEPWVEALRLIVAREWLWILAGTIVGLVFGILPGVGPSFATALAVPFTFHLDAASAIVFLVSIHAACAYGDSVTSVMLGAPGGPSAVASCWDGFQLTRQGKGGMALGLTALSSFIGGFIGWVALMGISPLLVRIALKMGPAELFMVALFALVALSIAVRGNTVKGLIMGCVGLLLSTIGPDAVTGQVRFTFGSLYLQSGIEFIPVVVGVFALSQVISLAEEGSESIALVPRVRGGAMAALRCLGARIPTVLRGGAVGLFLGLLPGVGASGGSVMAYLIEKNSSRDRDSFGKGNPAGLIAPEVAKGCSVVGDLIPTFTLGIPGGASAAIILTALIIHGVWAGPEFFAKGSLPYVVFAGVILAQLAYACVGLALGPVFARLASAPNVFVLPALVAMCFLGAYAVRHAIEDVIVLVVFGVAGYFMRKHDYPAAALVLGLVLGELAEFSYNRGLMLYGGFLGFLARPIALSFFILSILALMAGPTIDMMRRVFARS